MPPCVLNISVFLLMKNFFFLYKHMYTFLLTEQIHNNNKIKRRKAKDTTLKHVLVFPFIKNKAS